MRIAFPPRRRQNILLVSMVDVLLTLVFFFLLASSFGDGRRVTLDLGGSVEAAPAGDDEPWTLEVLAAAEFRLNGLALTLPEIESRLTTAPGTALVLQPGPAVSLQQLINLLDRLKPTGARLTLGRPPETRP